jgi:hypothetical protein
MQRDDDKAGSEHAAASRSGEPTPAGGSGERSQPGCACVVKFAAFARTAPSGPSWTDADNWRLVWREADARATEARRGGALA